MKKESVKVELTGEQIKESKVAAEFIKAIFDSISTKTKVKGLMVFSIGEVEQRMKNFAKANGVRLASDKIYMSYRRIAHAGRKSKKADNKAVSETQLMQFPLKRFSMDLYYDGAAFVYTDYKTKYIISPAYELSFADGKVEKVAFVTASANVDRTEFKINKYKKI